MTIHHRNFQKLLRLLPDLQSFQAGDHRRLEAPGFMPLSVDVLHRDGSKLLLALAHYFELNGDLVPDPDIEIRVDLEAGTVEALSYQDLHRFDRVDVCEARVRPHLERSLDDFLSLWLSNLHAQGHHVASRG